MNGRKRLLLADGRIFLSEERIVEGSVLIEDECIAGHFAGSSPRIDAERVDLGGKLLIPGFIDAHTHLFQEGVEMMRPDLSDATSKEEMLAILRDAVKRYGKGEAVVASDFDESSWEDGGLPCRRELDAITTQHPLVARRICGHLAVGNSLALERVSHEWGGVERETGIMKEEVPLNLMKIFPPDPDAIQDGLRQAVRKANSLGITSIHEITDLSNVRAFEQLAEDGHLTLNVRFYIRLADCGEVMRPAGNFCRTTFGGIKLFADGAIGARTAANTFAYLDTPGNSGLLMHEEETLRAHVRIAEERGIQLAIHSIGDLAIKQVLNAYEQVGAGNPHRHRIEHAELVDEGDMERIRRLRITVSMQPNFIKLWSQPGGMYEAALGDRYPTNNPVGKLKRMGVDVAFGSDAMPMSPLLGIEGTVSAPFACQRMSLKEAIICYSKHSAKAGFSFKREGEIQKGKEANLVVLDEDSLVICRTFYRGKSVFGA